jgi:hypothetical protein
VDPNPKLNAQNVRACSQHFQNPPATIPLEPRTRHLSFKPLLALKKA